MEKVDTGKKLERGAYGDDVLRLQERLTELGFSIGKPDGSFGRRTEDAIKGFQGIIGRPVDGIVWPGIWEILFPDEEMQFARDRDKPTGIAGIFIPGSWERPAISTPDFVRAENNEEQVTEDKPALAVEIKVSNTPYACDYLCEGERVEYEITVTNTGNVLHQEKPKHVPNSMMKLTMSTKIRKLPQQRLSLKLLFHLLTKIFLLQTP